MRKRQKVAGSDVVSSCRWSFNFLVLQSVERNRKKDACDALLHGLKYELGVCMFSPLSVLGDQGRSH